MIIDTKIGIGIVHCQSTPGSTDIGYTPVYKSDNGKWSSLIDDTGDVFRHVKIEYDTILRMIRFSKDGDGWYMCSMKPIPGRDEEYRASWVYFPSSLDLSQKDIKTIIEVAESQIKEKEFDTNKLQEVILSYQKINEDSPRYNIPATQNGYAFRNTSGAINLYDLYGCMYQKEFVQYEWVILMDKTALTLKGNSVIDISDKKIVESHIIKPQQNDFGFVPYFGNSVFSSPIRIMDGEYLPVEFRKDGYLPISKNIKSQNDFVISKNECKKYFKKTQFVAIDAQTNKRISSVIIKPCNAKEDTKRAYWIFLESDLENAKINVMAEGYTAYSYTIDLREKTLNDELSFKMEPEAHEYVFVLPLNSSVVKDCNTAEITIRSQYVIKDSPFEGYRCSGTPREGGIPNRLSIIQQNKTVSSSKNNGGHRSNNGGYEQRTAGGYRHAEPVNKHHKPDYDSEEHNDDTVPKNPIWGYVKKAGIAIVAVGLLCVIGYFLYDEFIKDEPYIEVGTRNSGNNGYEKPDELSNNWDTAFGYLKEHTNQICKNDMECFDDLKGLYDIVNGYRFKDYIKFIDSHRHRDDILSIDEWKRLYDKSKAIDSNKKGVFNNETDEQSITFEKYFKKDFSKLENIDDNQNVNQNAQQGAQGHGQQGGQGHGKQGGHTNGQQGNQNNQQNNLQDNNV